MRSSETWSVAVTERVQDEQPALEIRQAGDITIDDSIDERVADDLSSAENPQALDSIRAALR